MIFRSAFVLVAGIFLLASLAACQSPLYDDPPKVSFNPAYLQTTPPPGLTGRDTVPPVVATDVEPPPRVTPPPRSSNPQTTQLPSGTSAKTADYPVGTPVTGKPGFVTSPYKPYAGYVDVRGFTPGEQVKCPYSGKIFLVP